MTRLSFDSASWTFIPSEDQSNRCTVAETIKLTFTQFRSLEVIKLSYICPSFGWKLANPVGNGGYSFLPSWSIEGSRIFRTVRLGNEGHDGGLANTVALLAGAIESAGEVEE